MPIQVDIVTPDKRLVSDMVDSITLPGVEGQMGIMHGHAPLLSTLDIGEIVLRRGTDVDYIAVTGGVVEVRPDKVTILAVAAEQEAEIDVERAEAARERARQSLAANPPPQRHAEAVKALQRSNLRLRVAYRRRRERGPSFREG